MVKHKSLIYSPEYWLFAFLWPVIIVPKTVQLPLLLLLAIILYLSSWKSFKLTKVSIAMLCLFFVHIFAIAFNLLFLNGESSRALAAVNTALLWLISAFFISYYSNRNIDIVRIGKYCCINVYILGILALLTIYLYYFKSYNEYVLFGKPLFGITSIAGQQTTRFFALNDYSNMNLIFIMEMFVLSVPYINSKGFISKLSILLITFISVVLLHSRSGFVLYGISVLWFLICNVPKRYRRAVNILLIIIALAILVLFSKQIWSIFINKIIFGNISSNNFRITLITASYKEALDQSPIWGMGIKEYYSEGYPLGSHSTYVGFFYKTGIIGVILGLYIFFKANFDMLNNASRSIHFKPIVMFLLSFIVLFAIEDVDGTNWSIIIYFTMLVLVGKFYFKSKKVRGYSKNLEKKEVSIRQMSGELN